MINESAALSFAIKLAYPQNERVTALKRDYTTRVINVQFEVLASGYCT